MTPQAESWKVMERAAQFARDGVEFVLATVVWRQAPSSGHQGARAIITADGEIHGWIGGACAEPVVIGEARRALADGKARLILLGSREQFGELPEGMTFVPMSCQSEGAMELYIEPVVPTPRVVVVGSSPMAETLVELATAVDWAVELVSPGDLALDSVGQGTVVVVATQGHGDEEAVEAAVRSEAGFVGLVASRKRGESVLGYLADRGVPADALARVRVPVGIDLGHTSHKEIAVSVLAELVRLRASGELATRREPVAAATEPVTAVDLVCGMTVAADDSSRPYEYESVTYYFCCPGCRAAFVQDPAQFIGEVANAED